MPNDNEHQNIELTIAERTPLKTKILISLGEGNRKSTKGPRSNTPHTFNGQDAPEKAVDFMIEKFNLKKYLKH